LLQVKTLKKHDDGSDAALLVKLTVLYEDDDIGVLVSTHERALIVTILFVEIAL